MKEVKDLKGIKQNIRRERRWMCILGCFIFIAYIIAGSYTVFGCGFTSDEKFLCGMIFFLSGLLFVNNNQDYNYWCSKRNTTRFLLALRKGKVRKK